MGRSWFARSVHASVEVDTFDPHDLSESAGRIFDQFEESPALARLTRGTASSVPPATSRSPVLLALVVTIATTWTSVPPEFAPAPRNNTRPKRRAAVVEAVRRLAAPDGRLGA